MENVFLVLWFIVLIAWLAWLIGYPIYKKVKIKYFDWSTYALGLCSLSLALNIVNLFIKMVR